VRRSLLLLALGLVAALPAAPAHASCAATVQFGGQSYAGSPLPADDGAELSNGVLPGCNDTVVTDASGRNIAPQEPDTPIVLHRIAGVPARLAVAYNGRAYLARGYLPQLATHPLHGAWSKHNQVQATSCGKPWRVSATALTTPTPGPVPVKTAGGRQTLLQLVADTRVTGLDRAGFPYLGQGQSIRALVRSCDSVYGGRVLLARRVSAAR
jgi:hypothetical protein